MNTLTTFKSFLKAHYQADLRSLAIMRIGLAFVVLADLFIRLSDFRAHYTESGVWPSEMLSQGWKTGYWTFHTLSHSPLYLAVLFTLQIIFGLTFLLGYYARLSALLLVIFYISLHNRNIFILQAGDDLLRLVLLWCALLPVGGRYSIDYLRKKSGQTAGLAYGGYLLLISSVYLFTVLLKSGPDWRLTFDAVYYALQLGQLRLPFGDWLLQQTAIHRPLTILILLIEISIPVLILWPSKKGRNRLFAFILILLMQLCFGMSLYVGLFWIIAITSALALLPSGTLDGLERLLRLPKQESIQTSETFPLINYASVFIAALCLAVNLSSLKEFEYEVGSPLAEVVNAARLDQYWGMFSPGVLRTDGYLVYHGMDSIGRQWDLRLDQDYVDYHEPAHIVDMYKNDRWRKWAENMQDDRFTFLRPLYCQYTLRSFNQHARQRKVKLLKLYWMQKTSALEISDKKKQILYCICNED